jgi:hypothetical protein
MKYLQKLTGLALVFLATPWATGCIARVAPFDQMDRAQVTVLRLSQPQAAQPPTPQASTIPGLPSIPGLPAVPPEVTAVGQQILQGVQNAVPGLIPNVPGLPGATPAAPQLPLFKGYSIVSQAPLLDTAVRDELLDIFGHENSFNNQAQRCFSPGMAFVLQRPNAPEVDVLISLSCNQAMMDGARWPHPVNGFTPETRDRLGKIYEKLFGPVPPGA